MLDIALLLQAYANGLFPMADNAGDTPTYWVEPKVRAIFPLDGLHISKSLRKSIRQGKFKVTCDLAFADVMRRCGEYAKGREETWINDDIFKTFCELHCLGHAHSVECWQESRLVGGLYGVEIGRVFCGESMFSRANDASKTALVWLAARLQIGGYQMLDCQFMTDHLASLGAVKIPQAEYITTLQTILRGDDLENPPDLLPGAYPAGDWHALEEYLTAHHITDDPAAAGEAILKILSKNNELLNKFKFI